MLVAGSSGCLRGPRNSSPEPSCFQPKIAGCEAKDPNMYQRCSQNGALLDLQETSEQPPRKPQLAGIENHDDLGLAFRHSGWTRERDAVDAALVALGMADHRIDAFRGCGRDAWVLRSNEHPDRLRISANYCHDRFCLPCATHRGAVLAARIRDWLGSEPARFVTLTLASDSKSLTDRLDRLILAFRRLRRTRWWRGRVKGGIATTEIKWSVKSSHWHPHLHILCRGDFLPAGELSKEWHIASGDSYIVDVQLVNDPGQAASYIAKYVSKPCPKSTYHNFDRLQEMMMALTGRRLFLTFGTCNLPKRPLDTDPDTWVKVQSLDEIMWKVQRGVPVAPEILALLKLEQPCKITPETPLCRGSPRPHPHPSQN